jgi:hypothetical protein
MTIDTKKQADALRKNIEMAEKIQATTYTFNEEKVKVVIEEIKAEISKREKNNEKVPCKPFGRFNL